MTDRLDPLNVARAVLLFHGAAYWSQTEATEWFNLTQRQEATTRNLCDFAREVLAKHGEKKG